MVYYVIAGPQHFSVNKILDKDAGESFTYWCCTVHKNLVKQFNAVDNGTVQASLYNNYRAFASPVLFMNPMPHTPLNPLSSGIKQAY